MKYFGVNGVFLVTQAGLIPLGNLTPRLPEPPTDDEVFEFDGNVDLSFTISLTRKQSEQLANNFNMTFEDAPEGTLPELN